MRTTLQAGMPQAVLIPLMVITGVALADCRTASTRCTSATLP